MRVAVLFDKRELPEEVDVLIEELISNGMDVDILWHYLGTVVSDWLIAGDYYHIPGPGDVRRVAEDFFEGFVPIKAALPVPGAVITSWHETLITIVERMRGAGLSFSDLHFHLDDGFWFRQVMVIEGDDGQNLRPLPPGAADQQRILQYELPLG